MVWIGCAVDERRRRMSGLMGIAGPNPSCGSFRPEPDDSQLEPGLSISVDPIAAQASTAGKADKRIAATASVGRADEPFGNGTVITSVETPACCARH